LDSDTKASLLARLTSTGSSEPAPEVSPKEPPEGEARQQGLKPNKKTNMVAREVFLNATGVRPGKTADERELFTEETSSVLVHENGGIIQLSASVARGELLLLANVESKRQVVAQVKRTYQQMNRCVELEFAEPAPRFWGTDFSAAAALLPKAAKDTEAAARILSEAGDDQPAEALPPPTADQVEALKREVRALREKTQPHANAVLTADDEIPADLKIAAQVPLPKPSMGFTMPPSRTRGLFRARGKFTPGAKLRLAALTAALLVTVVGTAWLKNRIASKLAIKASSNVPAVGATVTTSPSTTGREAPERQPKLSISNAASEAPTNSSSKPTEVRESPGQSLPTSASKAHADVRRTSPSTTLAGKAPVRPPAQIASAPIVTPPAESVASTAEGVVVPPKLIKSVKAVASLDDLRDFETGNVVINAVVGTEGEVHYITVISGPPSLRGPAVEAVKQYRYQPATRNGQPIPEHVHITVRFRFES
jgi:periplasmic protein TonB